MIADTELAQNGGIEMVQHLQQLVIDNGKCNPNVCFAMCGADAISDEDFQRQKEFVELVSAIIGVDTEVEFSAVQYGLRNTAVSGLTRNANQFLARVSRITLNRAPRTFLAAGVGYCIQQLRKRPGDANKIVILGDGRSNFGGNPVPIAQQFLPPAGTGSICAVGIGFADISMLEQVVGGHPDRVIAIDDYFQMIDILELVVADVCGLTLPSVAPSARKYSSKKKRDSEKSGYFANNYRA